MAQANQKPELTTVKDLVQGEKNKLEAARRNVPAEMKGIELTGQYWVVVFPNPKEGISGIFRKVYTDYTAAVKAIHREIQRVPDNASAMSIYEVKQMDRLEVPKFDTVHVSANNDGLVL